MFAKILVFCFSFFLLSDLGFAGNCPKIVTKRQWGGRTAKAVDYQTLPVENVIIHHTVSQKCDTESLCSNYIKNIQEYHMDQLDYDDIGYNFLVGNDGNVYEGCGWHKVGAHTYGYNRNSMAIAFVGNFDEELPPQSALNAAKKLLSCGVQKGELHRRYKLVAARQISSTESPGRKLFVELQDWDHYKSKI
ncbi:PGLYRP1.2 family protein [Megaselia abdita]